MSYATAGERCRCDSDLTTPWLRRASRPTRLTGSGSGLHGAHAPTGFTWPLNTLCTKPDGRGEIYKTALGRAPHKASVQDLVQLVERREELGRHLLVRPVGRVDALELLLLVGALRVEQQVQEKHNQLRRWKHETRDARRPVAATSNPP